MKSQTLSKDVDKLIREEALYRDLMDSYPHGLMLVDKDTQEILYANEKSKGLLNMGDSGTLGTLDEYMEDEDIANIKACVDNEKMRETITLRSHSTSVDIISQKQGGVADIYGFSLRISRMR